MNSDYQSGAVSPVGSIQEGWNIIKNDYWTLVLMSLVAGIILLVLAVVLGLVNNLISAAIAAVLGAATTNAGDVAKTSASVFPQIIAQIVGFFTNIILNAVGGMFFCGFYTAIMRSGRGEKADFGDLFAGFQYFQSCLIFSVIYSAINFIVGIGLLLFFAAIGFSVIGSGIAGILTPDGKLNPAIVGSLLAVVFFYAAIAVVFSLVLSALTVFVYPLFTERKLAGIEAFMTSAKSGLANIGGLILLLIVTWVMLFVGAIPCLLGLPFLFPIYIAAIFSAYRSVFGILRDFGANYNPPAPPTFGNQPGY